MRRREFLGLLSGAAAWPNLAGEQDSALVVGYLSSRSEQSGAPFVAGFQTKSAFWSLSGEQRTSK
jgi:hypothetical protein